MPNNADPPSTELNLIDCDVHNYVNSIDDLVPFLSQRWRRYIDQSGFKGPPGPAYPKGFELASRVAADRRFAQVLLLVRSHAPYGRREFRPLFEAAVEVGLPVGIHFGGSGNGNPITACGWPSYYLEDHTAMAQASRHR